MADTANCCANGNATEGPRCLHQVARGGPAPDRRLQLGAPNKISRTPARNNGKEEAAVSQPRVVLKPEGNADPETGQQHRPTPPPHGPAPRVELRQDRSGVVTRAATTCTPTDQ